MCWLDDLQRVCVSADNAVASYLARSQADSADLLPQIEVPTLVLHSRDDQMNAFDDGVYLASHIEGEARRAGELQPHRARRRAGVVGVRRRGRGVHEARAG